MSQQPHVTVFFLGHGSLYEQVRAHVADLTSLGHVRRSYWIDTHGQPQGQWVRLLDAHRSDSREFIRLVDALRDVEDMTLIVAIEDPAQHTPPDNDRVDEWVSAIETYTSSSVGRLRMLLPQLPLPQQPPQPRDGWSTIAVSPEDADGPTSSRTPLLVGDGTFSEAASVFAPVIVSLTGLWVGSTRVPVLDEDNRVISTGTADTFRLARAFHRTLDASQVENDLMDAVVDIKHRIPLTHFANGHQSMYVSDARDTSRRYVDVLLERHHESLLTPETPLKTREAIRQSGWAAVVSFVKEFFRAVVGSPAAWSASVRSKISEDIAGAIQRSLYGEKTMVEVVVGSASARSSIEKLKQTSAKLSESAHHNGVLVGTAPNLAVLWHNYTDAALTLVDGADRMPEGLTGPIDHNHNPFVVHNAAEAVPDVEDSFAIDHPVLQDILNMDGSTSILPFDVYRAEMFEKELQYAVSQTVDSSVLKLRDDFHDWKHAVSGSFAWAMGTGLLNLLSTAQQRTRKYYTNMQQMQQELDSMTVRDYAKENRRLAAQLWGLTIGWFLSMLVVIYSTIRFYQASWRFFLPDWLGVDWTWALLLCVVLSVVFIGTQMAIFARARRGILDEVERQKLLHANMRIALQNCSAAIFDVNKLSNAYTQFLSWNMLLGRVIAYPFGRQPSHHNHLVIPTDGLPRSTQLGTAIVNEGALVSLSNDVRRHMFEESWAGSAWTQFIDDAFHKLHDYTGTKVHSLTDLYGLAGSDSGSVLDELSRFAVGEQLESRNRIHQRWAKAISAPRVVHRFDEAVSTVEYNEKNETHRVSQHQFIASLDYTPTAQSQFITKAVAPGGVNRGATTVDESLTKLDVVGTNNDQLTNSVTLAQFGAVVSLDYLVDASTLNPMTDVADFTPDMSFDPGTDWNDQSPSFGFPDSGFGLV